MEIGQGKSAADLIAEATEAELLQIIRDYGEERRAASIVRTIIRQREETPIETTDDLRRVVEVTRPKMLHKTLARVFQAFRIAVNGELEQLAVGLRTVTRHLCVGGRIAVIAYHSLEDRIVKQFMAERMKRCVCPPRLPVCVCDQKPEFCKVGRGRIRPSEEEIASNSRARSAVLRVYERVED
jgi:16S rRNA (cytosine1402-N4)-methyltransferase